MFYGVKPGKTGK